MRTSFIWLGAALVLAGPLACEPAAPPVVPTPGAAPSATPSAAPVAKVADAPSLDLTPVAEPADLVGVLRWKNPGMSFANLAAARGSRRSSRIKAARRCSGSSSRTRCAGLVDAKQMASAIAAEAPMDLVVALDQNARSPKPYWAFSMGLTSIDGARAAVTPDAALVEVTPGTWRIGDKEKQRDARCVIAASSGPTPARLVCSDHEKDVLALAPYLTRTLPLAAPATSDLHAELRITPIEARFGQKLRQDLKGLPVLAQSQASIGDPGFDDALLEAANALTGEVGSLVGDLDKLTLDVGADRANCLTTTGSLQLRGKSSWFANTMAERADRAGAPPALYWKLPKDADTRLLRARHRSLALHRHPPRAAQDDRRRPRQAQDRLGRRSQGPRRAARHAAREGHQHRLGQRPRRPEAARSCHKSRRIQAQQIVDAMINSSLGWYVMGFDDSPDAVAKSLKSLVSVYGRKGLIEPLKKEMRDDARYLPTVKMGAGPASLGKGAQAVEMKFEFVAESPTTPWIARRRPKGDKVSFTFHILLDAGRQAAGSPSAATRTSSSSASRSSRPAPRRTPSPRAVASSR
jgi:hypothetical protein